MADSGSEKNTSGETVQKAVALGHAPEADQRPKVLAAGHGAVAEILAYVYRANNSTSPPPDFGSTSEDDAS